MQYKTREAALKALKKIGETYVWELRAERLPGEYLSPMEIKLVENIIKAQELKKDLRELVEKNEQYRKELEVARSGRFGPYKLGWNKTQERKYRELKSIARGLGLFPITDEVRNYLKVTKRILGADDESWELSTYATYPGRFKKYF